MVEWGRKYRENDEKSDEDCIEKSFSWPGGKFDRDGKGGQEALGMGYCSINM